MAKVRAEREAAQAKRKAEADGRLLVLYRIHILPFELAKAAEIEAKKAAGRR